MKNVMMVKLSEIKEDFNPRTDFSSVTELAKSIASVGLLQPIVVQKKGEGFKIVDGACRYRALKSLEQKETQVIVIDAKSAEEAQMAANLMRADLNLIERARGYERMVRLFPARYNAAGIAKMFGEKKQAVERLISVAKRIPASMDIHLGPLMGQIDFEEVEMIAQIPTKVMEKAIRALDARNPNIWSALSKIAKQLDYNCDALTTGKLVSAGRAFVVKRTNGSESAWTTDEAAYKEAKDAYEAKQKKAYGSEDKAGRAKIAEKSEKQKAADRAAKKKEKEARMEAVKELPALFLKFIAKKPSMDQVHAAAKELFEHHMDSDKCRRLWAAFKFDGCSNVSSYELRGKTYDVVVKPHIKTPEQVAMVLAFTKAGWKDGVTPEQAWVSGMKKS